MASRVATATGAKPKVIVVQKAPAKGAGAQAHVVSTTSVNAVSGATGRKDISYAGRHSDVMDVIPSL